MIKHINIKKNCAAEKKICAMKTKTNKTQDSRAESKKKVVCLVYFAQQQTAKMPAAGSTQALRLFCNPLVRQESLASLI